MATATESVTPNRDDDISDHESFQRQQPGTLLRLTRWSVQLVQMYCSSISEHHTVLYELGVGLSYVKGAKRDGARPRTEPLGNRARLWFCLILGATLALF